MVPKKPANIKKKVRCLESNAHSKQQQLRPIAGEQQFMKYQVLDKSFLFYNLVGIIPQLGLAATVGGKQLSTMKQSSLFFLLVFVIKFGHCQDSINKSYLQTISLGSTAPSYLIIEVRNVNTNTKKEICIDEGSLFKCLELETIRRPEYEIIQLIRKSNYYNFANEEALEIMDFSNYNTSKVGEIITEISKIHLIDSLHYIYSVKLQKFALEDKIRKLKLTIFDDLVVASKSQNKSLASDLLYEDLWNFTDEGLYQMKQIIPIEDRQIFENKLILLKGLSNELDSLKKISDSSINENFESYFYKYGKYFVHALFKYGIICGRSCYDRSPFFSVFRD